MAARDLDRVEELVLSRDLWPEWQDRDQWTWRLLWGRKPDLLPHVAEMGPPETTRWEYPFADHSRKTEIAEFIAAIHEGRRPIGDAAEAVGSMSVIERVYQGAWG